MIIVCDTSPLCYLLLIGEVKLLPQLYDQVLIPIEVAKELSHPNSPVVVKNWINHAPSWLIIENVNLSSDPDLESLDSGKQAAIILAERNQVDLVVIDEALGRKIAQSCGLRITGLLGVLNEAKRTNLIDLPTVINRLQKTSFRVSPTLINSLLQAE